MECQDANRRLGAYADNELSPGEHFLVAEHLATCDNCARKVHQAAAWKNRVRAAVQAQSPALGLETRVRAAIAGGATVRSPLFRVSSLAAGAMAVVVLSVGLWAAIWEPMQRQVLAVLGIGAADHVHCTLERKSPPPGGLQRPIDPEYGDLLTRVRSAMPKEFETVESHFCRWQGRRFQHFVFARDGHRISLIVTPKKGADAFPRLALLAKMRAQGIPVYQAHIGQNQTAGFESGHNLAFLVSDLDAAENGKLMASLVPAVRDRM